MVSFTFSRLTSLLVLAASVTTSLAVQPDLIRQIQEARAIAKRASEPVTDFEGTDSVCTSQNATTSLLSGVRVQPELVTASNWTTTACPNRAQFASCAEHTPTIAWVGCSDARVPESVVCSLDPCEIFVLRNIGNIAAEDNPSVMSGLQYAVQVLGVQHIVVAGHTSCGAVKAGIDYAKAGKVAAQPGAVGAHLRFLNRLAADLWSRPSSKNLSSTDFENLVMKQNVLANVARIAATDIVQGNWRGEASELSGGMVQKPVQIHGWAYDVTVGQLQDLNFTLIAPNSTFEAVNATAMDNTPSNTTSPQTRHML
ncbi:unnamed protein product [Tilletia controversa]|uniref:Carbonic anhydrase n=3 Tax=Tilletia TaxID=13289 RepID=A0A8X7SWY7_9BASI|nr:hypothetical protein CF336_g4488 [Tilletia laevis]KAE8205470.1 hypothetical protein CF328_g482 [Tilletia controversa]KAE8262241.1 hypothetical protein A4X03_0g2610 [Tilletia caries]KAE8204485.1 hypothetical protein CF335_g2641 [Tilletia laevis]KAE8248117.1 hypothetical protein A4X06_0g3947 [Tilletia controversa]